MQPGFKITNSQKSTNNFPRGNEEKRNTITQMYLGHLKRAGNFFQVLSSAGDHLVICTLSRWHLLSL